MSSKDDAVKMVNWIINHVEADPCTAIDIAKDHAYASHQEAEQRTKELWEYIEALTELQESDLCE